MQVKLTIRDDIYKQLKEEAKRNFRTITEEINYRLSKSLSESEESSESDAQTQTSSLHYPEGVRSAENPYYEENTSRRSVIG